MEEVIIRPLLVRSDKIKYLIVPKKTNWEQGDLIVCKRVDTNKLTEEKNG